MFGPHQTQRVVALCVVTAWASLCYIHLADAVEDAQAGPEHIDVLVAQALAMPAEQSVSLSETQMGTAIVSPGRVSLSTPAVFDLPTLLTMCSVPSLRVAEQPSPRAKLALFQLFSVYRL